MSYYSKVADKNNRRINWNLIEFKWAVSEKCHNYLYNTRFHMMILFSHNENTPIQIYWKFHIQKMLFFFW